MTHTLSPGFLGLNAQDWYALGTMLLGVAAVAGGGWAIHNYRMARRAEAARWLQGVFADFYLGDTFNTVRKTLEYHYREVAGPLLSRRITDPDIPLTDTEESLLTELDTMLNYYEYVLYLEEKKQFSKHDRESLLDYWFTLMNAPERASLRRYVARFGFERIQRELGAPDREQVAVYGSLREGFGVDDRPDVGNKLVDKGRCVIKGAIYDVGGYPGLADGDGVVVGELYEVLDLTVFPQLDEFEKYNPLAREKSLYLRLPLRLVDPPVDAWVYVYNSDVTGRRRIDSGDWARDQDGRSAAS
jgi:gamma-glutamylcyclotransferase (GGCT)/AIG2-like uncharacterized protein YtfP